MPLDDFFAKKEKKKKKKTNPNLLLEQLTKEVVKSKISVKDVVTDATKHNAPENDEWENIEDEDDLDLQNIDVSRLTFNRTDDTSTSTVTEKEKNETSDTDQVKIVWGAKRTAVEEPKDATPPPEPEPKPEPSGRYIPAHLRKKAHAVDKPNVANPSDFPTLDDTMTEPTTNKDKYQETPASTENAVEEDSASSWSLAGASRRLPRASDTLPIAISNPVPTTNPSAYVPPYMRSNAVRQETPVSDNARQLSNGSPYPSEQYRSHDSPFSGGQKYDSFAARQSTESAFGAGSWSRGNVISTSSGASGIVDSPAGTNSTYKPPHARLSSNWSANVNVKTFRDTNRDKAEFELAQSNRFAGFNET